MTTLTPLPPGFRSPQVCELAGVTYRQLVYWEETGLLVPSLVRSDGSGSHHLYSEADVDECRVIAGLIEVGFSLGAIRGWAPGRRRALLDAVRDVLAEGAHG